MVGDICGVPDPSGNITLTVVDADTVTMTGSLGSYECGTAAAGSDVALICSTVAVLPAGADCALIVGGEVAAAFTGNTAATTVTSSATYSPTNCSGGSDCDNTLTLTRN